MEIWNVVIAVSTPLLIHLGLMIWWMGKTTTEIKTLREDLADYRRDLTDHIEEDMEVAKQVQSLAVNEANFGGMLTTMAAKMEHIRETLDSRQAESGRLLQLHLDRQSAELIMKFRAEVRVAIHEYMTDREKKG